MLKKTYRAFLVLGMAVGVVAGIFFLCSVQRQIADNAETAEIRRKNAQNAKIYLSPKEVKKNTLFALHTMLPKEFEAADGKQVPIPALPAPLFWKPMGCIWRLPPWWRLTAADCGSPPLLKRRRWKALLIPC